MSSGKDGTLLPAVRGEGEGEGEEGVRSFVVEADELLGLVKSLSSPHGISPEMFAQHCKRATDIVSSYQEQPYLLDPLLNQIVPPLMEHLRILRDGNLRSKKEGENKEEMQKNMTMAILLCQFVYTITKVRSHKIVVRFFPHEIVDLEPTLEYLQQQGESEYETWEVRYVLLLWLSILCMIPFAFSTMDTGSMVEDIIKIAQARMADPGKTREAAAELVARIITRPDLVSHYLPRFLEWNIVTLQSPPNTKPLLKLGVLTSLAHIFKLGKRQELIEKAGLALSAIGGQEGVANITLRKLTIKLVQRIGLVFLKPRSQNWRYQKTTKKLLDAAEESATQTAEADESEDIDIPEAMEEIIDKLLVGLKDKDTVVRWSAAKGIGRIASRLPQALADDIVEHVLELFNPLIENSDAAWHGGSLAIAELARRGLLLPVRLSSTLVKVFDALQFDTPCGTYSVGSHVRDAACYVCWSFARAYSPSVLEPHILKLANALIVGALFDREINCRRAASAAFQENVGRLGNIPYGIEIIGTADYFSVSNRANSYLDIAPRIAAFPDYTYGIVDHLVKHRVGHWDLNIRELAAKSLARIAPHASNYIMASILPSILHEVTANESSKRHGSILALAELLLALTNLGKNLDPQIISQIRDIVPALEHGRLYRGRGGEHVRAAACRLIESISLSNIPLDMKPTEVAQSAYLPIKRAARAHTYLEIYQTSLDENIVHALPTINQPAVSALQQLCARYYLNSATTPPLIAKYSKAIKTDPNPDVRRGYCMALGSLSQTMLQPDIDTVLDALFEATLQEQEGFKDAETRQKAVLALSKIVDTLSNSLALEKVAQVLQVLCKSAQDYTTDHRGDVGSWVRLAAMDGIEKCAEIWGNNDSVFTEDMSATVVNLLIQQSLEKMDKIRKHALRVFFILLHTHLPIPLKSSLLQLFPLSLTTSNFSSAEEVNVSSNFSILSPCLHFEPYRYYTVLGFAQSVGGVGKNVAEISAKPLFDSLQNPPSLSPSSPPPLPLFHGQFMDAVIKIFVDYAKDERVIIPLLKTLTIISEALWGETSKGSGESEENRERLKKVIKLCGGEVRGSKDMPKLGAFVEFAGALHICSKVDTGAITSLNSILLSLLTHRYPLVRKNAASTLFKYLLQHESASNSDAQNILEHTDWTQPALKLTTEVHKIYNLMNIAILKKKVSTTSATLPNNHTVASQPAFAPAPPPTPAPAPSLPPPAPAPSFDASDEL